MNSRITAILIGLLSVTGVFATTAIEQNDSITNEIVSDSITMAMPSDSITIQVTDTDSIARQQEADKNLLSLLETDSTEQILPDRSWSWTAGAGRHLTPEFTEQTSSASK